jgi:DNA-binding HxlR family transcriptional regulator
MKSVNVDAGRESAELCPTVTAAFVLLGRKWTGMIIKILKSGDRQFSDLLREVPGLSARMLALRLRELEESGIVGRIVGTGVPIHVRYHLSGKGRALATVLEGIVEWARTWADSGEGSVSR